MTNYGTWPADQMTTRCHSIDRIFLEGVCAVWQNRSCLWKTGLPLCRSALHPRGALGEKKVRTGVMLIGMALSTGWFVVREANEVTYPPGAPGASRQGGPMSSA
jgi:hypothetical protein